MSPDPRSGDGWSLPRGTTWPVLTISLAAVAIGIRFAPSLGLRLEDRPDLLTRPWRIFTGHLAHGAPAHLAWNLLLLVPLAAGRERARGAWRLAAELAVSALCVGLAVRWLHPDWTSYRGLSGIVYSLLGLWLLDSARPGEGRATLGRWLAALGLAGLAAKTILEVAAGGWVGATDGLTGTLGVRYLPGSHAGGLLAAALLSGIDVGLGATRSGDLPAPDTGVSPLESAPGPR